MSIIINKHITCQNTFRLRTIIGLQTLIEQYLKNTLYTLIYNIYLGILSFLKISFTRFL